MSHEEIRHWWGLKSENGCPCLRGNEYPQILRKHRMIIERLVRFEKLSNKFFCMTCKSLEMFPQEDCPYQNQFENLKDVQVILAPMAYGRTKKIGEFNPDEIVIVNCILDINEHPKRGLIELQLQRLIDLDDVSDVGRIDRRMTLKELNNHPAYEYLIKRLGWIYEKNIKKIVEEAKEEDWEEISSSYHEWFMVSVDDIDTYCKQARVYEYCEQFSSPTLYNLLNEIIKNEKETKVTIIEGRKNSSFIESLADRYYKEREVKINFIDDGLKPEIVDCGTEIHEITNCGTIFCRKTLENPSTRKFIKDTNDRMIKHEDNIDPIIGVIINKPEIFDKLSKEKKKERLEKEMRQYVPERFKNVKIETRYNSEGSTNFRNCDTGIIVGSPIIDKENIAYEFFQWNGYRPKSLKTIKKDGRFHYVNPELDAFRKKREEDEAYNELRLFYLNSRKIHIYDYGKVSKLIEKEGIIVDRSIDLKYLMDLERSEWLEEFVKERSSVSAYEVDKAFAKRFDIGKDWSYRTVLRLVKKSERLTLKRGALFYDLVTENINKTTN